MKRARRKQNKNRDSKQRRSGDKEDAGCAPSSEDAEDTDGNPVASRALRSPNDEMRGQNATESENGLGGGSRKQLTERKVVRNDPHPSAETLRNRHKFDEGLRRGLLQAATSNSALPEWLVRRKSYGRAGEFYVRLKAELVTPERRDHAKIKRMLAELDSSQQQDASQHGGADDSRPIQDPGHVDEADAEDVDEAPVEQPVKATHQHLTHVGEHMQPSTKTNPNTLSYHNKLRKGLLEAAENGTLPSGWLQDRGAAALGDFWVRLKEELLSETRDESRVKRMLDEMRNSEQQGAEAANDERVSAGEEEEASLEERNHPDNDEAGAKLEDHQDADDDDSDDDVFVRWPRRRQRRLARPHVEEES